MERHFYLFICFSFFSISVAEKKETICLPCPEPGEERNGISLQQDTYIRCMRNVQCQGYWSTQVSCLWNV